MFSFRPIGRLRFFMYSLVTQIVELLGMLIVLTGTIGLQGLVESPPGSARAPLALGTGLMLLGLTAIRIVIASKRVRDGNGSRWLTIGYGVLLLVISILTGFTMLVWTPETGAGAGLGILGIVAIGLWFSILILPTGARRDDAPMTKHAFDGGSDSPGGLAALSDEALLEKAAQLRAADPSARNAPAPGGASHARPNASRPATFGKRGLV